MGRVRQVVDDRRVGTGAASVTGEDGIEVDGSVEAEASVGQDIDPVTLVIPGCIEDGDLRILVIAQQPRLIVRNSHRQPGRNSQ